MLNNIFGDAPNTVYHPPTYFDNTYEDSWLEQPLAKEMVQDIDKSEVVGPHLIESPVLGPVSPKELSGGVKTLILMAFDDSGKIFNASACGDNCAQWIVNIGKEKNLTINLHHVMDFSHVEDFRAKILNTGKKVGNYQEYLKEIFRIKEN